jgi:hypothetical protein
LMNVMMFPLACCICVVADDCCRPISPDERQASLSISSPGGNIVPASAGSEPWDEPTWHAIRSICTGLRLCRYRGRLVLVFARLTPTPRWRRKFAWLRSARRCAAYLSQ